MRAKTAVSGVVLTLAVLLPLGLASAASELSAVDLLASLKSQALANIEQAQLDRRPEATSGAPACSIRNAIVRRDWEALTKDERRAYVRAVKCLKEKPSQVDPALVPGARTRYDDFVAVHINQTSFIHASGWFLTWHRYFTWVYEQALRDECGYKGYQPYVNWFGFHPNITKNSLFDGSDASLGGDGKYFQHNGSTVGAGGLIWIPSGNGGGCVTQGPFANMNISLGPTRAAGMRGLEPSPTGNLGYNPRCLRRDLSSFISTGWMTYENLFNVTVGPASGNITLFQDELQGRFSDGFVGIHSAGHQLVGGDASDPYSSTNEPTFFLHHATIDLIYWLWQALHMRDGAAYEIDGTVTMRNIPPSRNALKSDVMDIGPQALLGSPSRPLADLLDTMSGDPFCYIYV